jgi:hypothetical protein
MPIRQRRSCELRSSRRRGRWITLAGMQCGACPPLCHATSLSSPLHCCCRYLLCHRGPGQTARFEARSAFHGLPLRRGTDDTHLVTTIAASRCSRQHLAPASSAPLLPVAGPSQREPANSSAADCRGCNRKWNPRCSALGRRTACRSSDVGDPTCRTRFTSVFERHKSILSVAVLMELACGTSPATDNLPRNLSMINDSEAGAGK